MRVEVEVDVDPADVLDELDDKDLEIYGLKRCAANDTDKSGFEQMRLAVHRRDLGALLNLVEKQARDADVILDTSALLKVTA